ncbi:MAG: AI-2E family transporter [Bacteroidota bacterium]
MKNLSRINKFLIFILAGFALLHFGAAFLIPFLFGAFFASLMKPVCNFLESLKMNRIIASLISTFVVFIVVGGLLFLFVFQVEQFLSDIGSFKEQLQKLMNNIEQLINSFANITEEEQKKFWAERSDQILDRIESLATNFFSGVLSALSGLFLILIYVFLLLLYRDRITKFIMMYISENKKENTEYIMDKMSRVVYHYLWGRAKVMSLLGIMYYVTFLIFDLPYALLITIFGALITIIPYLGPFISGTVPIIFSFIFFDSIPKAVIFSIIIIIEQLIESYVFEPWIIGREVKLNPLIVIMAIIVGGMVWGLPGMILFVPLFAIVKIISNHSNGLEPIGFLLGNSNKL